MSALLTCAQMRAIEADVFARGDMTSAEAMERAGRAVVRTILDEWPEFSGRPSHAVVMCGPGNNGGDGYVVARRLAALGWRVEVFALGDPGSLPEDARTMHDLWVQDGQVAPLSPETAAAGDRPDLLVDALFGIGLARPLDADVIDARRAICARSPGSRRCRIVAVDCVSGLDADSGRLLAPKQPGEDEPDAVHEAWFDAANERIFLADLTVTFHAAKLGHVLDVGPLVSGTLRVVDLGFKEPKRKAPVPISRPTDDRVRWVGVDPAGKAWRGRLWPGSLIGPRRASLHKYERGHVFVMAGGVGHGGAARLAARAALRVGAGLVTLGCTPPAVPENAARLDAIMLRALADSYAVSGYLRDPRISALCLGPGLGLGSLTQDLVRAALGAGRPTVLDADALTSFEDMPETLLRQLHPDCVLTPHEGEFARLFPDLAFADRVGSKVDAVRQAASRAGCTVLLKGPDTVIASSDGSASVHAATGARAAPWLGTAGSGDVLAGMIAGLAAQWETDVHLAAEAAAWLHVEAARAFGPGLIAEDLPEALPAVFRALSL